MSSERHCELCGATTTWLHRKEAALQADVTPHTISAWAKSGMLHLVELPNHRYLVCERSLWGVGRGGATSEVPRRPAYRHPRDDG